MNKRTKDPVRLAVENDLCSGCGLCNSIASNDRIKMNYDHRYYLRPRLNGGLSDNARDIVQKTCPGIAIEHPPQGKNYHPLWGPLIKIRAGYSNDETVRFKGSSGGALTAILIYITEKKLVEAVLQVGADSKIAYGNETRISSYREEIINCAGSRYAPSSPLENLKEILSKYKSIAVAAKPCDIAALRKYLEHDSQAREKVKLLVSFFCAGVPSLTGAREILQKLKVAEADLKEFHYRGEGWPGETRAILKNGAECKMTYDDGWGGILNRHLQLRCKICPDGTGEFADIACADAWHLKDGQPDFSERPGRSLIISRTDVGEKILSEMIEADAITAEPYDIAELEKVQPYQARRKKTVLSRLLAMRLTGLRVPRYKNLMLVRNLMTGGFIANARSFLGMFLRGLKIRADRRHL